MKEKKKLEFTDQELNVVIFGLQKLPYETVAELIPNIVRQLQAQEALTQPAQKEEKEEVKQAA